VAYGAQVLDSVSVMELVESINGHPEMLLVAQDDHLQREQRIRPSEPTRLHYNKLLSHVCVNMEGHLKVLSRCEGEGLQVRFLWAPALRQEGVPDDDLFLQTGIQMKNDVVATHISQINTKTEK
ncbi:hypothetical protein XENOCAPTIV_020498, partial [Xenoophorus captivus]